MPPPKGNLSTSPSPEFMEKLGKHWRSAQINMPKQANKSKVRPMGKWETKLLSLTQGGEPSAMTYPNNTIAINPSNDDIRGSLAHELTHVGQKSRGLTQFMKDRFTPWNKRPQEIEAINYEGTYPWKEKGRDTWLPPEKKANRKK